MSAEKKNNSALFLYTALIFLVALLMIVLSFFGQSHMENTNEKLQEAKTITERASVLSEENLAFREQILELQEKSELYEQEISGKQSEIDSLKGQIEVYNSVLAASELCNVENYELAAAVIAPVNGEALTGDLKLLYDRVITAIEENKEN